MSWVIDFQNNILNQSPALFPLLGIVYSLVTSVHCSAMCSPFLPCQKTQTYIYGRMISYTIMGGLFGFMGRALKGSIEFDMLSLLGFFFFALLTVVLIFSEEISKKIKPLPFVFRAKNQFFRGLLTAFIPCHLLLFFYSLAAMTTEIWGGALILFAHSVATLPALFYGRKILLLASRKLLLSPKTIKIIIILLSFLNLFYFVGGSQMGPEVASQKFLFCF